MLLWSPPSALARKRAIFCGQTLFGQIDVSGDAGPFTFTAQAGDVVSIITAEVEE